MLAETGRLVPDREHEVVAGDRSASGLDGRAGLGLNLHQLAAVELRVTEQRDEQAAKTFLPQAIRRHGGGPETITIEGSAANEAAMKRANEAHGTAIAIRKIKSLNNMVEQDHRAVKRGTRPMLGCTSFEAAQGTLAGIECLHMLKKKQLLVAAGDEGCTAAEQFYALAASSPHSQGQLPFHDLLSRICDTTGFFAPVFGAGFLAVAMTLLLLPGK